MAAAEAAQAALALDPQLASRWRISEEELNDFQTKFAGAPCLTVFMRNHEELECGLMVDCLTACTGEYEEGEYEEGTKASLDKAKVEEDPLLLTGPFLWTMPEPTGTVYSPAVYWNSGTVYNLMGDECKNQPRTRRERGFSVMRGHAMSQDLPWGYPPQVIGGENYPGQPSGFYRFSGMWTQKDLEARILAVFRVMWLTGSPELFELARERLETLDAKSNKRKQSKSKSGAEKKQKK